LQNAAECKEDNSELLKKIETLEKQLERKEELLKKMTDLRRTSEPDNPSENASLKK